MRLTLRLPPASRALVATLVLLPLQPFPADGAQGTATWHVAPNGDDAHPGDAQRPFASLERARDAIRTLPRPLPEGGVTVWIHDGEYPVRSTFRLTQADSGTDTAPIVYRAADGAHPRFSGGRRLRGFTPATAEGPGARLPDDVRNLVRQLDLRTAGIARWLPLELGGFGSGRGFRTHPVMEVFVDHHPLPMARWPNEGFVHTDEVLGPLTLPAWDGKRGAVEGRFRYSGDRPTRWIGEPDAWLYGYWFWDWADGYERIARIDPGERSIELVPPWHRYGYRHQQRYHAIHILAELDAPGEWYLDRASGRLFVNPPRPLNDALVELSLLAEPMMVLDNASHVTFEGLLWELGAADGIKVRGGTDCRFIGCTIRKLGGTGLEITGGHRHRVQSCDLHTLGRGALGISGGDRRTLTPGGHVIENCHLHHLSRIDHTYTPGVWLDGVGHRLAHNLVHHVASSAFRVGGNDHLIELNEVHRVVLESDDQGGADLWGNATYRGIVFRHNYWHHLGNWDGRAEESPTGQAGIRLDDAISGVLIEGNVFQRCSAGRVGFGGVQIHGGKDNHLVGNLFVDCGAAVSFTAWGDRRWREFVRNALADPAIDRALYLERYPALARLADDHDVNRLYGNVALRCARLLLRSPGRQILEDNRELDDPEVLREGPDGRLVWSDADARRLGLPEIPFSRIGLYQDTHRRRPLR